MSTENGFIGADYEQPKGGGGFTELQAGLNKLRILSAPLMMWLEWRDGKPIRHAYNKDAKPPKGNGQKDSVKHAWGLIVFNYKTEKIELFECDKQDIITALVDLSRNPSWGHPKNYDVVINKKGSGMDTEYTCQPEPPTEVSNVIVEAYTETPIDLSQLLVADGKPFVQKSGATIAPPPVGANNPPVVNQAKVVTPENWVAGDEAPNGYILAPADGSIPDGYQAAPVAGLLKKKLPF